MSLTTLRGSRLKTLFLEGRSARISRVITVGQIQLKKGG